MYSVYNMKAYLINSIHSVFCRILVVLIVVLILVVRHGANWVPGVAAGCISMERPPLVTLSALINIIMTSSVQSSSV